MTMPVSHALSWMVECEVSRGVMSVERMARAMVRVTPPVWRSCLEAMRLKRALSSFGVGPDMMAVGWDGRKGCWFHVT